MLPYENKRRRFTFYLRLKVCFNDAFTRMVGSSGTGLFIEPSVGRHD